MVKIKNDKNILSIEAGIDFNWTYLVEDGCDVSICEVDSVRGCFDYYTSGDDYRFACGQYSIIKDPYIAARYDYQPFMFYLEFLKSNFSKGSANPAATLVFKVPNFIYSRDQNHGDLIKVGEMPEIQQYSSFMTATIIFCQDNNIKFCPTYECDLNYGWDFAKHPALEKAFPEFQELFDRLRNLACCEKHVAFNAMIHATTNLAISREQVYVAKDDGDDDLKKCASMIMAGSIGQANLQKSPLIMYDYLFDCYCELDKLTKNQEVK